MTHQCGLLDTNEMRPALLLHDAGRIVPVPDNLLLSCPATAHDTSRADAAEQRLPGSHLHIVTRSLAQSSLIYALSNVRDPLLKDQKLRAAEQLTE